MSGLGTSPSKVTLNFETAYTGDVTVGIGYNLKADPYWEQADGIQATPRNGKFFRYIYVSVFKLEQH